MALKGRMRFQTMQCLGCGAKRLLGVPCDECGRPGPADEVNAHVVRRRSAVRRVDELVAARVEAQGDLPEPSDVWRALHGFRIAVKGFAEDSTTKSIADLARAVAEFSDLQSRSQSAPAYRPRTALRAQMLNATDNLVALWPLYRDTLTSANVREVQRLNVVAQEALQRATDELESYIERADAFAALSDGTASTLLERTMRTLISLHEGSLVDVASIGSEAARQLTGQDVAAASGAQFLIQDAVASIWLDRDHFQRTIAEASRFCLLANFASVLQSDRALHGIAASQRRLAEAVLAFEAILATEVDEDTLFRRLLQYHAELYEQVGGPLFAWYLLLSGAKSRPYEKLMGEGATALAKSIDNVAQLSRWFEGREPYLRNAPSHVGGFHVEAGVVHITLESAQRSHPVEWVVDRVYAFLESMLATSWALFNELDRRDIEVPISEADQKYLGLTSFAMAEWFAATSFQAISSRDDGGEWHFALPAGDDDAVLKALTLIGNDLAIRSVSVVRAGSSSQLQVPFDAWEKHLEVLADGTVPAQVVSLLEFRARCTVEGNSILKEGDLRSAAGALGLAFMGGDVTLVPYLRRIASLAVEHDFAEPRDRTVRALRVFRTEDEQERARLSAELLNWIDEPLAMPTAHSARVFRHPGSPSA